jgi:quinol monooxygenase YgiN
MPEQILTTVTATVDPQRETELTTGFREITARALPDGLIRTELLRGRNGTWRIQSLWRDRAALEAVRNSAEPPAALELFSKVGADHSHEVFTVEHAHPS